MTSMTDAAGQSAAAQPAAIAQAAGRPRHPAGCAPTCFPRSLDAIITLLLIFVLGKAARQPRAVGLSERGLVGPRQPTPAPAARLRGLGACWAVIPEKYRFILFGTYPFDQQWRPALASLIFIALFYRVEPPQFLAQGAGAGLDRPR